MITASLFLAILLVGVINTNSLAGLGGLTEFLRESGQDGISEYEAEFADHFWIKNDLINLNGTITKTLNMHILYSNMGIYVTKDNYIVSAYPSTSTDYEYEQTVALNAFLSKHNVNLLYVNQPVKYIDDSLMEREFSLKSYGNQNADTFLSRIREAGVQAVDLRENIVSENLNSFALFYRTDHHWTVPTGLWASGIIAGSMNQRFGYHIDMELLNPAKFTAREWKDSWLGEQGRKIAQTYVGLDSFVELKPSYPTDYTFKESDGSTKKGTFDAFINEAVYNTSRNVYENGIWHYSYSALDCINNNVKKGKVLLLGDSYAMVTEPFLSLGVREIDFLDIRYVSDDFSLCDYIIDRNYDTVLICYAQFMIGAHDDPNSANFRMFDFV